MSIEGLEKLDVWRKAKDFAVRIYQDVLPILPTEEKWGLAAQLRRSAQSIPANIAEGYGRYYYQENIHFCYIARGSLEETLSHLSLAHELGMIPDAIYASQVGQGDSLVYLVNGYIGYLKHNRHGSDEPALKHTTREIRCDYEPAETVLDGSSVFSSDSRISSREYRVDYESRFSILDSRDPLEDQTTEEY
jgi:four helix bundle protein